MVHNKQNEWTDLLMMNSGAAQDLASPSCHSCIRLETTETQREEPRLSEFKCWKLFSHLEQQQQCMSNVSAFIQLSHKRLNSNRAVNKTVMLAGSGVLFCLSSWPGFLRDYSLLLKSAVLLWRNVGGDSDDIPIANCMYLVGTSPGLATPVSNWEDKVIKGTHVSWFQS